MRTVYKYELAIGLTRMNIPWGAEILSVGEVEGALYLWAMVDTTHATAKRRIGFFATGVSLPEEPLFPLGSVVDRRNYVWHVFEGTP